MMRGLVGPSLHITWEELACKDGVPYLSRAISDGTLTELVVVFERIRRYFDNRPLIINSAYRTPSYNKKVGGSPNSQHMLGRALDIQPPKDMTSAAFFIALKNNHKWMGIRGLGKYPTFVHVDIRKSDELITWEN